MLDYLQVPREYRHTLQDLRVDLVYRLAWITLLFGSLAAYAALAQDALDPHAMLLGLMVAVIGLGTAQAIRHRPAITRRLFILGLNIALWAAMLRFPNPLYPFLGLVLIFAGHMVVTHSGQFTTASLIALATLLDVLQIRDYPLFELISAYLLCMAVTWGTVETVYTALMWYSTMERRADQLLREAREHRADLVQAVKSLDNANLTQQRLQQELVRAHKEAEEARRLKERFAANISHELRTPLNLIVGFSEVMYLSPEVYGDIIFPPKLRRDIYQIHRSSRYLLEMIDDILDLSHIELSQFTMQLEPTDLNAFVPDVVDVAEGLFRRPGVGLAVDLEPNLPMLEIDRTRIRQVLLNLLNNAQRFTNQGTVRLSVQRVDHDIVFRISDTGMGIPPEKLEHIFDEFFQVDYSLSRRHGGAGLGLAISKRFVEAHRGAIWVESTLGVGSSFTFTLPLKATHITQSRKMESPDGPPPHVLVIDPDPAVVSIVERHLAQHRVVQVSCLEDIPPAIARYKPRAIIKNTPPAPFDFDVTIPLIECTLPGKSWMVERLGVAGLLAKPIRAEELIATVQAVNGVESVMVVDDDRGFVQLIERMLETHALRMNVLRAYDGKQALYTMRQQPPDLVLLDLAMPEMDGFAVIDAMRDDDKLKDTPIVLITATRHVESAAEQNSKLSVQQAGGLNPAEVLACIQSIVQNLKPRYGEAWESVSQ